MNDDLDQRDAWLGAALEILVVAASILLMTFTGPIGAGVGLIGLASVISHRSLARAARRDRIAAEPSPIERALNLLDSTKDWTLDVVPFVFLSLVVAVAIPRCLELVQDGALGLASLLGVGVAASIPALALSGRELIARVRAQFDSRRLLANMEKDQAALSEADETPTLGSV